MSAAVSYESKIPAALLTAIKQDPTDVHADVMVQLESPEQVMDRACATAPADASRGQRTTCMVDSMQKFADEAQEQVKELLARATGRYESSTFFWINNSVSVKKAQGALILEIAQLDTVLSVRAEQIFQLQGKTKEPDAHSEQQDAATTTTTTRRAGGMTFSFEG